MIAASRLAWLARRLRRTHPGELPFRARGALRSLWQRCGFADASTVPPPAVDSRLGAAWVAAQGVPEGIDRHSVVALADRLVAGQLEVFGETVPFVDGAPDWNRDPVTGIPIPLRFGLFIDFRHIPGLDIKFLWEVNRHCWWTPVAQAYALTRDLRYLDALTRWLNSWLDTCPYPLGPNWSSPVEHGIRLINWSLVWHLIGGVNSPMFTGADGSRLKACWLDAIYRHMRFASDNYSFHSSADNHLIGEAAGVFVAAQTWDLWTEGRRLGNEAKTLLEREALLQFAPDGVNREQALCYHKFSLEFLIASGLSARANGVEFSAAYWSRIEAAILFVASMMDCYGRLPAIGDADDAAVFELAHGEQANTYATLLTIGAHLFASSELHYKIRQLPVPVAPDAVLWLFGRAASHQRALDPVDLPRRFEQGGYFVIGDHLDSPDEVRLVFDAGELGYPGIGGHAHADALSVLLTWAGVPFLVDAGTYCYNAAPSLRRYFRGTSAHNTLEVDGVEQSIYGGGFLWLRDVNCTVEALEDDGRRVAVQARHDGYKRLPSPVEHRRRVEFDRSTRCIVVTDELLGNTAHSVVANWHFDVACQLRKSGAWFVAEAGGRRIGVTVEGPGLETRLVHGQPSPPQGWVSNRFYVKQPAWVLQAHAKLAPCAKLQTTIRLEG